MSRGFLPSRTQKRLSGLGVYVPVVSSRSKSAMLAPSRRENSKQDRCDLFPCAARSKAAIKACSVQIFGHRLPVRFMVGLAKSAGRFSLFSQLGEVWLPKGLQTKHFGTSRDSCPLFADQHSPCLAGKAESRHETQRCCSSCRARCSDSAPRHRRSSRCSSCHPRSHRACQAPTAPAGANPLDLSASLRSSF